MDNRSDTLERLIATVETLERRVEALERSPRAPQQIAAEAPNSTDTVRIATSPYLAQGGGVVSVLGKAMLGIAGAYLLRALAESSTFPRTAVVAIAIGYAATWLVASTRVQAEAWLASVAYAGTSFLIVVPMLWELTFRFNVLPTALTAAVLGSFVLVAYVLAWKRHFAAVVWVATAAGCVAMLVMSIATHDLAPFIVALFATAIASEYAAANDRKLRVRFLVAAVADIAVWALIYISSRPAGVRTEYKQVSSMLLLTVGPTLLLIYAASATAQTMLRRHTITFFEAAQTLIALLLTVWSVFLFWSGARAIVLGSLCLLASAVGYAIIIYRFGGTSEQRNYHVYAAGSAVLFLAGSYLCLPTVWLPLCLSVAALAATSVGVRTSRLTLEFHGLAFLTAAAFSSGLLEFAFRAFAGTFPGSPAWLLWFVSVCAILCYAVEGRCPSDRIGHLFLYVLSAAIAVCASAALLVWTLVRLLTVAMIPGVSHIAVIRTLTACAIALVLAYAGSRWQRRELGWLAYGALVFVALKLLFEDLRHGHMTFTAASIFLYAITLLSISRLVRLGQKARGAV